MGVLIMRTLIILALYWGPGRLSELPYGEEGESYLFVKLQFLSFLFPQFLLLLLLTPTKCISSMSTIARVLVVKSRGRSIHAPSPFLKP